MPAEEDFLTIRIDSELKSALQAVAEQEGRTPSNLVKFLIRQYCEGALSIGSVRQTPRPYQVRRTRKKK